MVVEGLDAKLDACGTRKKSRVSVKVCRYAQYDSQMNSMMPRSVSRSRIAVRTSSGSS